MVQLWKSPALEYIQVFHSFYSLSSPPDASHCCTLQSQVLLQWKDILSANLASYPLDSETVPISLPLFLLGKLKRRMHIESQGF